MTQDPDQNSGQKRLPPKKYRSWEEEKEDMKKVIEAYARTNKVLTQQNFKLKKQINKFRQAGTDLEDIFTHDKEGTLFRDVGGLDGIINQIRIFQYGIMNEQVYSQFGISPPKGLLLHGPPGNGKTMLARAMSNELEAMFAEIMIPNFMSEYVGVGERKIKDLLMRCEEYYKDNHVKVVLFFDEADQLFLKRGSRGKHPAFDRCLNVLLGYMDGVNKTDGILYVASTNRVDMMDEAALRPGRFDFVVEVCRPDEMGVEDILYKQMSRLERKAKRRIFYEGDYSGVARRLYRLGPSGADIAEVVRLSAEKKIREIVEAPSTELLDPSFSYVGPDDLEYVVENYSERITLSPRGGRDRRPIGFLSRGADDV